jgi:hypothetical protein
MLIGLAIGQIADAAKFIPLGPDDEAVIDAIVREPELLADPRKREERGIEMTDGVWAILLRVIIRDHAEERPEQLIGFHKHWAQAAEADPSGPLVAASVKAGHAAGYASIMEEAGNDLAEAMVALAEALLESGHEDQAYNSAGLAADVAEEPHLRRRAATLGLELGLKAQRSHQVAFCSVVAATATVELADRDPDLRLEAFDAVERALEHAAAADPQYRDMAAKMLLKGVHDKPYLRALIPGITYQIDGHPLRSKLMEVVPSWPPRITRDGIEEQAKRFTEIARLASWLTEIDSRRLDLQTASTGAHAKIDWIRWTLDHPAYRHAVPHSRSFFREKMFDSQICTLAHEYTHVLSLVGALGMYALALRAAAFGVETAIWSQEADVVSRVGEEGVGPLQPGSTAQLIHIWTPWLEGLAIFAETGGDPALDPVRIGHVANLLRNLIDFEAGEFETLEQMEQAFGAHVAEFENRFSDAIRHSAPNRSRDFFVDDQDRMLYLSGYLAVRSVVASWRDRFDGELSGPQALDLLIHATRFGTREAVPALDLGADDFFDEARDRMVDWMRNLAQLPIEDVQGFVHAVTETDGAGVMFRWTGGRVGPSDGSKPAWRLGESIEQASMSLAHEGDSDRLGEVSENLRAFAEATAEVLRTHYSSPGGKRTWDGLERGFQGAYAAQSMLPVGETAATFFLNLEEEEQRARLFVQLRTTEEHVDGGVSANALSFPLPIDEALELAEEYRRIGSPRIKVTRLADVAGQISGAPAGTNIFRLEYGNWHCIQATTAGAGELFKPGGLLDQIRQLADGRMAPPAVVEAEMRWIADGKAGAKRTLEWLRAGVPWEYEELGVDAAPWRALVEAKAEAFLDLESRRTRRRSVCQTIIKSVFDDEKLVSFVMNDGITRKLSAQICEALAGTAGLPRPSDWLDSASPRLGQAGAGVFAKKDDLWDVRVPA